jgi:two-component system chemotaxis response regulator CheB
VTDRDLIVIGASWGGLHALQTLLGGLPGDLDAAIAVAQHRSPDSQRDALTHLLAAATPLEVCEAEDKDPIVPGTVYLAPPDYHLLVEPGRFALSTDVRVQHARPSIDVLFESAADAYGPRVVGVVVTGANEDGAQGLARVKERGGFTIVQDPCTAEKAEMPQAAIGASVVDEVVPVESIAKLLVEQCGVGARVSR